LQCQPIKKSDNGHIFCRWCEKEIKAPRRAFCSDRCQTAHWESQHRDAKRLAETKWRKEHPDRARAKQLRDNYGITIEQYNQMFDAQDGKCAICGRHQSEFKRHLSVDHDHTTGKIRKLLCTACNSAVGLLRENVEIAQNLISYLGLSS
jgi:endogenous inhibitor of DNA gyrase (YacG/DUF329 family)